MTDPITYGPVDEAVKAWLKDPAISDVAATTGGRVYLAMPKSAALPVLLVNLIGGGPAPRGDLPLSRYRFSFDAVATDRATASAIARALLADLDTLGRDEPGYIANGVYLGGADILGMRWQPDPDSDTPRYIVDALITTVR
jgi:Protein of unknown function (DUF3168)